MPDQLAVAGSAHFRFLLCDEPRLPFASRLAMGNARGNGWRRVRRSGFHAVVVRLDLSWVLCVRVTSGFLSFRIVWYHHLEVPVPGCQTVSRRFHAGAGGARVFRCGRRFGIPHSLLSSSLPSGNVVSLCPLGEISRLVKVEFRAVFGPLFLRSLPEFRDMSLTYSSRGKKGGAAFGCNNPSFAVPSGRRISRS